MRYRPDHKERTHKQIVATAAGLFRKDGVVATGVISLMKSAGLTQGGFYAHFDSKEALIREAATAAMQETCSGLEKVARDAGDGPGGLRALIDAYLSVRHLDSAERGCAIAAVGAELAREPAETRQAVSAATGQLLALIARQLPPSVTEPQGVARAVFGLLSGTLQLARLAADPAEAQTILEDGRRAAMRLCDLEDPRR